MGPRQRHVEQATLLGRVLGHRQGLMEIEVDRALAGHVDQPGPRGVARRLVRIVEDRYVGSSERRVPGEGHEHDRVLQALGAVDGLHLDGVGIGLEPALAGLRFLDSPRLPLLRLGDRPLDPHDQRTDPSSPPDGMHLLGDMREIGHEPLPIRVAQHPRRQVGGPIEVSHQSGHTVIVQNRLPGPQPILELEDIGIVKPDNRFGRLADQHGRRGQPNQGGALGPLHRQQEPAPLLGRRPT